MPLTTNDGEIIADKSSGEVLERVKGTSELTVIEFMEFTENVRLWSADFLGLILQLPEEQVELSFKNHN